VASYTATVAWKRGEDAFTDSRFSRLHTWSFDGGIEVRASASPQVVRPPLSATDAVDPEEAFVAALSSCHMLFFLAFAARQGFRIDAYRDEAEGTLGKNAEGRTAMTLVVLRPEVHVGGEKLPSREELMALHHKAHEQCYIANSVTAEIRIEPVS
jgi:organic hydroperoxide reductase OsmC/OhrA